MTEPNATLTERKNKKCSKKAWCWAMAERLREPNDHRGGIHPVVSMNLRPRAGQRTLGVGFRTRAGQKPTLFNVCPWCAQPILWAKNKGSA